MGICESHEDPKNSPINSKDLNKSVNIRTNERLSTSASNDPNYTTYSNETEWFPKGEYIYPLIKDSNISTLFGNKNNWQSKKIELFFSLLNCNNYDNLYSFSFTIINNNRIGIKSYLGDLEHNRGRNIYFGTSFLIDYFYEREQKIILELIINNKKTKIKSEFLLKKLIDMPNKTLDINIPNVGTLKINYYDINNNKNDLSKIISNFIFNITLYNTNNINSEYLFFVISHFKDSNIKRPVYKSNEYYINTNMIKSNLIKIESDCLCRNYNDEILLEIYSNSSQNFSTFIAKGTFNLSSINNLKNEIPLVDKYNQENLGHSKIEYYENEKISYIDKLLQGKMQINLEIAIDYTKSNGDPKDPTSNHFIYGRGLNDYETAIKSCCDVLAPYDADQLFPVYGFGGVPLLLNGMPNNKVSHCFNINYQKDPEIHGVENILQTYKNSLETVELSGNTKFSYVLNKVINNINNDLRNKRNENHYYILLILTDGVVNDLKDTTDLIVEASSLPLSIVIVGIGNEDFGFMESLDGDEAPLTNSQGVKRKRDIVQFIKFNKFKNNNAINSGTDFAEEVLKEIPRQIEEYYNNIGKFY